MHQFNIDVNTQIPWCAHVYYIYAKRRTSPITEEIWRRHTAPNGWAHTTHEKCDAKVAFHKMNKSNTGEGLHRISPAK